MLSRATARRFQVTVRHFHATARHSQALDMSFPNGLVGNPL